LSPPTIGRVIYLSQQPKQALGAPFFRLVAAKESRMAYGVADLRAALPKLSVERDGDAKK
jgi:hypothetical protein